MADSKLVDLTSAAALDGTEVVYGVQSGLDVKILGSQLATYVLSTGGGVSGSGTSGQVSYWNGANTQAGSNNLFWDNTNNWLGITTNAPTHTLTFGSTSTGIADYRTVDQTTNYERGILGWSGTTYQVGTQLGGTGTGRALSLVTGGTSAVSFNGSNQNATFTGIIIGGNTSTANAFQSNATADNGSFQATGASGRVSTNSRFLLNGSSETGFRVAISGSTTYVVATSDSYATGIVATTSVTIPGTGTNPVFSSFAINPLTINTGTGTLSNAATHYIAGPASGSGIPTNNYSLWVGSGVSRFGGPVQLQGYTVATLPAGVQGMTAFVTDALTPTYLAAAVGGGAVVAPVFHNGTTWITQ